MSTGPKTVAHVCNVRRQNRIRTFWHDDAMNWDSKRTIFLVGDYAHRKCSRASTSTRQGQSAIAFTDYGIEGLKQIIVSERAASRVSDRRPFNTLCAFRCAPDECAGCSYQ